MRFSFTDGKIYRKVNGFFINKLKATINLITIHWTYTTTLADKIRRSNSFMCLVVMIWVLFNDLIVPNTWKAISYREQNQDLYWSIHLWAKVTLWGWSLEEENMEIKETITTYSFSGTTLSFWKCEQCKILILNICHT